MRLDREELGFRAIPVVGDLDNLTGASVSAIAETKSAGVFGVFAPKAGAYTRSLLSST